MSWLTNFVRPKIRAFVRKTEVPDNLWDTCPACAKMIFHRDLEANQRVCPHCGHHMRLPAKRRLETLFDDGVYARIELPKVVGDPLKFRDQKKYADRLKAAREKTGEQDAILVAHGRIGGMAAVVAAFDFEFQGGSMGIAVGEGLVAAAKLAVLQQATLIAMLQTSDGATIDDITAATGWQAHTVRGAMAGALKKKLGLTIASEKVDGRGRCYRIVSR